MDRQTLKKFEIKEQNMKRFLLVMLFLMLITGSASAQIAIQYVIDPVTGLARAVSESTPLSVSATPTKVLPFRTYLGTIGSNSATLFRSIASFSAGEVVLIRTPNGRVYHAETGVSTASAILGDYIESGEQFSFTPASSTAGTWGSSYFITTTPASIAIRVFPVSR
jgi:hypothetical protein